LSYFRSDIKAVERDLRELFSDIERLKERGLLPGQRKNFFGCSSHYLLAIRALRPGATMATLDDVRRMLKRSVV
jgi:hypothetical protein